MCGAEGKVIKRKTKDPQLILGVILCLCEMYSITRIYYYGKNG
jgi:hypothetical protein